LRPIPSSKFAAEAVAANRYAEAATRYECDYIYEVMRKDAVEYFEKSGLEKSLWQNIGS
jgi:hypothetical protein